MASVVAKLIYTAMAFAAGGGESHTHGGGGETEHLYPILAVFAALIVGGVVFHFIFKKK